MTNPLVMNARIVAELRQRLIAEYGDDNEALEDTLEGATDLPEQLARLARYAVWVEGQAEAMKGIIQANKERKARFDARSEKTRATIAWALSEAGMKKIPSDVLPDLTVTMREGQRPIQIMNDEIVPDAYCRIRREPNKTAIRAAMEAGEEVPGAYFGNAVPILMFRST